MVGATDVARQVVPTAILPVLAQQFHSAIKEARTRQMFEVRGARLRLRAQEIVAGVGGAPPVVFVPQLHGIN